ncbi:AAA family ATPase [Mangrovactinospora gilvigrisea]|uniref:AAA family ATPase n=1 Tax=Mangrovactinospora gilvigrisea TaxID=1428644 RepID=UPI001114BC93|nr:AAA family ATPase [Mangrovactinospora gilvigrisea]
MKVGSMQGVKTQGSNKVAVLVNGVPGSGKSTLARELSNVLGIPLASKDVIKEALADTIGIRPFEDWLGLYWNKMYGAAASETMWSFLRDSPCGMVLESTWPGDETWKFVQPGLERAGVDSVFQIWCSVPIALARSRCEARFSSRHRIHGPLIEGDEWSNRWAKAEALPISETLVVDTSKPVDIDDILTWIEENHP